MLEDENKKKILKNIEDQSEKVLNFSLFIAIVKR